MKQISRYSITIFFLTGLFFFAQAASFAQAGEVREAVRQDSAVKSDRSNPLDNRIRVLGRGLMNLISLPVEVPRTVFSERKKNPKGWLLVVLPRTLENVMVRGVSAARDSLISPFYDSTQGKPVPWSRRFDLPDYPWQTGVLHTSEESIMDTSDTTAARFGVRG